MGHTLFYRRRVLLGLRVSRVVFVILALAVVGAIVLGYGCTSGVPALRAFVIERPGHYTLTINGTARTVDVSRVGNLGLGDDWKEVAGTVGGRPFRIGNRAESYLYPVEFCHYWIKLALEASDISPENSSFQVDAFAISGDAVRATAEQKISGRAVRRFSIVVWRSKNADVHIDEP